MYKGPRIYAYYDATACRFIADKDFVALQTLKFESAESAGFRDKDDAGDNRDMPKWAVRAGPRDAIYFNPPDVTAAIVTCGGLCPGLNDVVQNIVFTLSDYGVRDENILGKPPRIHKLTTEEKDQRVCSH